MRCTHETSLETLPAEVPSYLSVVHPCSAQCTFYEYPLPIFYFHLYKYYSLRLGQ